ncbi:peptidase C15 [Leptolyngbya sp. AN02str]|uniref:pyroglutamyl-peptidase I family protein n=1 Tax=Leptolyngbya sp. AN02str TaxID=3423363 RepID=UPI003D310F49
MSKTLLLTSFTTWKEAQPSNASDDLLLEVLNVHSRVGLHTLRRLPVDFDIAPQQAIAHISCAQPDVLICCGMAETRTLLTVESTAARGDRILKTSVDLDWLIHDLRMTEISHNAGDFVCNHFYFDLLDHAQSHARTMQCVFVHVPILTAHNRVPILQDFGRMVERLRWGKPIA